MKQLEFISAGAGSGKTHTLTSTLGDLLASGQVRPSGVIATTFTKKAASELRERVRQRLLEQGRFDLASAMGQACIGTVNSVCGQLLQRFAFEAGLSPNQQVIDEEQAQALLLQAIDASRSGHQLGELLALVDRLGMDNWLSDLNGLVNQARANDIDASALQVFAVRNADELLAHFPLPAKDDLSATLLAAIDHALNRMEPAAQPGGKKNTRDYVDQLRHCQSLLKQGGLPWSEWVGLIGAAPEKGLQADAEPVQDAARRFDTHPQLHADIRTWLQLLFGLAADVLTHFQQAKRTLGVLDFTDQEHLALRLLDHPQVAGTLRDELDLLLVDEFQDTSPIQLALFMKLAQLARHTCWVGDIKQAIYGFRGSDTALMQSILAALPELGGRKRRLTHSYRSVPPLVNLVNAAFGQALAAVLPADEISLQPSRTDQLDQPAFANWFLQGGNQPQRNQALIAGVARLLQSGRQIVDRHSKQTRPLRAGDIAILSRSNDGVAAIADGLANAGISVATARAGLLATPEATLAMACLRRLNDPADTVATAQILSLAEGLEPEVWLEERLHYLAQGHDRKEWAESGDQAHPLLAWLAGLRSQLPVLAPAEALQRVVIGCGLAQRVLQWQPDPERARQRLANLENLLQLASQYEDGCQRMGEAATIAGLILWLQQLEQQGRDELALPAVDAVRVLTHHAAKGLEWPVVILTDLEKPTRSRLWSITTVSDQAFDARQPLLHRYIRYWPWPFARRSNNIAVSDRIDQTELARQFQQSADNEAIRLLYVSMTRARDMLILAHNAKASNGGWLDLLQADWLRQTQPDCQSLTLPDGQTIACEHWLLEQGGEIAAGSLPEQQLYSFPAHLPVARLPLVFTPSHVANREARIVEQQRLGERLTVAADPDWGTLGNAIHACLALAFCSTEVALALPDVERIFMQLGVSGHIQPEALLAQLQAFRQWLDTRWPGHRAMAEVPVYATMPNQQQLNGRIDLLLETADGYVLIDHKSSPLSSDQWQQLAERYGGQLDAYAEAVVQATGKPVLERWLYLPVAGGAVRLMEA
jgi:ATP-dependent helicase/nuclease subunit A